MYIGKRDENPAYLYADIHEYMIDSKTTACVSVIFCMIEIE